MCLMRDGWADTVIETVDLTHSVDQRVHLIDSEEFNKCLICDQYLI